MVSATLLAEPAAAVSAGVLRLPLQTLPQPDETTCGPTCLHAIYRYWGEDESLPAIVARARRLERGGTFAVFLACDALRKGYRATIYTYNLMVFDPTWFKPSVDIAQRLQRQRDFKSDYRLQHATGGYLDFLAAGGRLRFVELSPALIRSILRRRLPILTGLSSTYLYRAAREYGPEDLPDDIRGVPAGHFVVLAGYDTGRRKVLVVDPYQPNPYGPSHEYWISVDRAVGAILLGIVTHDANMLLIYPPRKPPR
ncbi:MAG TPA: hypothetical protein VLN59_06465 [Burkholderiales bacterium]|nr:hypothetical protein [Burkholderiales bacterium]